MDQKIGLYIDTGYGIGEALDIEALTAVANDEFGVAVCKAEPYWSEPDKLEIIRNDIANEQLTGVIIAGPSSRVLAACAGDLRSLRRTAHSRRGDDRLWADRPMVRPGALERHSRHPGVERQVLSVLSGLC